MVCDISLLLDQGPEETCRNQSKTNTIQMKKIASTLIVICIFISLVPLNAQSVNHVWSRQLGGTGNDRGQSIVVDLSGNTIVTGRYNGVADFDPGPAVFNLTSLGNTDIFVSKYDPTGNFLWARGIGGSGTDAGVIVKVDASGNIVVGGSYSGTVDFDFGASTHNLISNGANDIFILKIDASGNFMWADGIGGSNVENVNALAIDASDNIYVAGDFTGANVDFDPGAGLAILSSVNTPPAPSHPDIYILKLSPTGNFSWVKQIGASTDETVKSISMDGTGGLVLTGAFAGVVDFDPGPGVTNLSAPATLTNAFLLKLDLTGNFVWARQLGGSSNSSSGDAIATDNTGNIYTTGVFYGVGDFDPGAGIYNLVAAGTTADFYVSKLDASGNFVWAKGFGNTYNDYSYAIAADATSGVYVAGRFTGNVDFDPGVNDFILAAPNGIFSYHAFSMKLDLAGNFVWARSIAKPLLTTGSNFSVGNSIFLDGSGNVYTSGYYRGAADFDPGMNLFVMPSSNEDIFVQKLSQNSCGGPNYTSIALTVCDSLVIAGNTYKVSGTSSNIFSNLVGCDSIVNLNLTVNQSSGSSHSHTSCDSFTFNGNVYTTSGLHLDTFTNAVGCDSIVSLQLTLLYSTFDTLVHSTCDTFDLNGTPYYATGFYNQNFTAANGCDSVVVLDLTILNTLDTIPQTSCSPFVFNGSTYTNSGFYQHSFTSVNSCDSIVVLDLTINSVDATLSNTGLSLMAGATGATYQWYDCNTWVPIAGETAQSFVFSQPGSYAVEVTQNGCKDTSVCLIVNSVKDINKDSYMRLYPNPSDGNLTIEVFLPLRDAIIRVIDLSGRVVKTKNDAKGEKVMLDLSSLSSGLYIVEIEDNNTLKRANFSKL